MLDVLEQILIPVNFEEGDEWKWWHGLFQYIQKKKRKSTRTQTITTLVWYRNLPPGWALNASAGSDIYNRKGERKSWEIHRLYRMQHDVTFNSSRTHSHLRSFVSFLTPWLVFLLSSILIKRKTQQRKKERVQVRGSFQGALVWFLAATLKRTRRFPSYLNPGTWYSATLN